MVILPSTRTETVTGVTATPDDPRCVAIKNRYGDADHLYMEVADMLPKAETPSMVMVMRTYGPDKVKRQLAMRIRISVLRMDESTLNDEEVESIARAIAGDPMGLTLSYDLVLGFFNAVERGEYELYAFKPRHIISAWGIYKKAAHSRMDMLRQQAESEQRDLEYERHRSQCITLEEYKRRKQAINNQ